MTNLRAADVVRSVRRRYGAEKDDIGPEWAALEEFSLSPGVGHRRADLFLVRAWPGRPKGHERHCVEVKVSRSDLRTELANPHKSAPFEEVAHRFYLAVPAGLIKPTDVIPAAWGIYEISPGGQCHKTREAAKQDPAPLPEGALVEAFRRAARSEARIRNAGDDDAAAQVVDLRRRLAAAERSLHTTRVAADRDKSALRSYLSEVALAGGWLCVCGARLKKTKWEVVHADASVCPKSPSYRGGEIDLESLATRLGIDTAGLD